MNGRFCFKNNEKSRDKEQNGKVKLLVLKKEIKLILYHAKYFFSLGCDGNQWRVKLSPSLSLEVK